MNPRDISDPLSSCCSSSSSSSPKSRRSSSSADILSHCRRRLWSSTTSLEVRFDCTLVSREQKSRVRLVCRRCIVEGERDRRLSEELAEMPCSHAITGPCEWRPRFESVGGVYCIRQRSQKQHVLQKMGRVVRVLRCSVPSRELCSVSDELSEQELPGPSYDRNRWFSRGLPSTRDTTVSSSARLLFLLSLLPFITTTRRGIARHSLAQQ